MAENVVADEYADMGVTKVIKVCCNGNSNISVRAIPTVPTPSDVTTQIETQAPIILSANLLITRES